MPKVTSAGSEHGSLMIWVQLLAGPVLWSVHFILSYLLAETICRVAGQGFRLAGIHGLTALQDQQLAGTIMWVPAGIIYIASAMSVMGRWLFAMESVETHRRSWR